MPESLDYLKRIGYTVSCVGNRCQSEASRNILALPLYLIKANDLNKLNVIHITGTKGKVSRS